MLKHFLGKWTAEGTLKGENNNELLVKEDWTGKPEGEGSFLIEGSRTLNGETQPFKWTITHNPATDGWEAMLTGNDGNTLRFEGQFSEAELTMELKAVTGNGSGSITVKDAFQNGNMDVIESKVTFVGDQGQVTLEGIITHKKEKAQ